MPKVIYEESFNSFGPTPFDQWSSRLSLLRMENEEEENIYSTPLTTPWEWPMAFSRVYYQLY